MKTPFRFTAVLALMALSFAAAAAQNLKIVGSVADENSEPVVGANVLLLSASDSSLVVGTITGIDGEFEVQVRAKQNLILSVQMMGYRRYTTDILPKAEKEIKLETIVLAEDQKLLGEATVVAKKNVISFEAGKTIISPNASIITSQGNVFDVLKGIPGLLINEDGTIILDGKKGVTVQINGKTTYMSGPALVNQLRQLSAQSVDQLEVISNPTAQYDASGKAGVINIKMQRQQTLGQTLAANLNARKGNYAYGDLWARGNIQGERAGVFVEYFKAQGDREHHNDVEAQMEGPNGVGMIESPHYLQTIYKDASNMLKVGGDVTLSKRLTANGYAQGNFYRRHVPGVSIGDYQLVGQKPDSTQYTDNHSFMRQTTYNVGLGLEYRDERNREGNISVDALKYTHDESLDRYSEMKNFGSGAVRPDTLFGDLLSDIRMAALQANYAMPLSQYTRLEAGAKFSVVDIDNSAMYRRPVKGIYVPRHELNNKCLYTENNNAAYVQVNGKAGRLSFNAGVRVENTRIKGKSLAVGTAGADSSYRQNYTELFPTASLQFKIKDGSNVALIYNRRITRPNYRELSPFNQMWDEYSVSKGNPNLRAELTDNVNLAYTFLWAFRISLQASNTKRAMTQCFAKQENGGIVIFPDNMGSSRTLTAKLEAGRIVNLSWWHVGASVSVYNTRNTWDELGAERTLSQTTFNGGVNSQFLFRGGWSGQIQGYYNSDMAYGQILVKAFGTVSAGVQKTLWDDRATVRLVFNDIFSTLHQTIVFDSPDIVGSSRQRDDETYIGLSVSLNLKRGKLDEKKKRDTTIEESKRINL